MVGASEKRKKYFYGIIDDLKKGRIFPPIILDEFGSLMDGHHRMVAFNFLKIKTSAVSQQNKEE